MKWFVFMLAIDASGEPDTRMVARPLDTLAECQAAQRTLLALSHTFAKAQGLEVRTTCVELDADAVLGTLN